MGSQHYPIYKGTFRVVENTRRPPEMYAVAAQRPGQVKGLLEKYLNAHEGVVRSRRLCGLGPQRIHIFWDEAPADSGMRARSTGVIVPFMLESLEQAL